MSNVASNTVSQPVAIVLAAGKSKRMQSELPKVLHPACGRPIVEYVLDAARGAGAGRIVLVVGHKAEQVQAALQHHEDVSFALQTEQLGTGHAVMCAHDQLTGHTGAVLILAGDTPLLKGESLGELLDTLRREKAACVVGTARTENNFGLGRIVRDEDGNFLRIVEQRDASPEEQQITEINTGCFAFDGPALFEALSLVRPENSQGEYYLTDCAEILRKLGRKVVAACTLDIQEAMGINTQEQLAEVEEVMQKNAQ
ncbi:NTP transferase domain-containing protein [Planctomicrobium sp. SH527]|uniref:NTP transferase domain-containing protein n=1 Tax=Planctomicrobium sp. SH527 TaxID=3448123 RepID=UPI003F5C7F39